MKPEKGRGGVSELFRRRRVGVETSIHKVLGGRTQEGQEGGKKKVSGTHGRSVKSETGATRTEGNDQTLLRDTGLDQVGRRPPQVRKRRAKRRPKKRSQGFSATRLQTKNHDLISNQTEGK